MTRLVCIGAFAGAHGVRGEFKVRSFTEVPEDVAAYGPVCSEDGSRVFTLSLIRALKPGTLLARAPEIASREEAEALKGTKLFVPRNVLPAPEDEDEFYLEDLAGLTIRDESGVEIGRIKAVVNHGAGDIVEVKPATGKVELYPFTKEIFPEIDIAGGWVIFHRPPEPTETGSDLDVEEHSLGQ